MKPETKAKFDVFIKDLVKKFGEGHVATRKEVKAFHGLKRDSYPLLGSITRNLDYKIGRGQVIITASDNPAKVRDEKVEELKAQAATKEAEMLPEDLRNSPAKLAAELMRDSKKARAKKPAAKKASPKKKVRVTDTEKAVASTKEAPKEDFVSQNEIDEMFGADDDINDIMASL